MKDFFNIKKTGNTTLWIGGILGLFVGLFAAMEGGIVPSLFWIGIAIFCFYEIGQRKNKK